MKEKKIVVTGVASGIGAQTAKLLGKQGAYVIGLDRRQTKKNVNKFVFVDFQILTLLNPLWHK